VPYHFVWPAYFPLFTAVSLKELLPLSFSLCFLIFLWGPLLVKARFFSSFYFFCWVFPLQFVTSPLLFINFPPL
jgi:hypothetical protein